MTDYWSGVMTLARWLRDEATREERNAARILAKMNPGGGYAKGWAIFMRWRRMNLRLPHTER